ncbi:hypothetical protein [Porphyromonas sp.]|uniref:hypothetical protein n=1 Tax=Porphyromonas sp. TaxID=1924944 RepID=UPI0026DBC475|nr:hypothetical protein [Porphyromonas sp.]MDO4770724.1 hypothetical protein [Porphyromonas sp.]
MEKTNNIFSLKRVFNLIKMECIITWKDLLLFCSVAIVATLGMVALTTQGLFSTGSSERSFSMVMNAYQPVALFIFAFYYLLKMGKRLHKSDTIAYCSIPVTTLERFVSLVGMMVIYYLLSFLTVQIAYIGEGLMNPLVFQSTIHAGKLQSYFNIGGFLVVNPLFPFILLSTGSTLILVSVIFWGMIRFKHLFYGIVIAFALALALGYFLHLDQGLGYILSLVITAIAVIASYIALQKIQQRS